MQGLQPLGTQRDHPVAGFLDFLDAGGPLRVVTPQEPLDDGIGEVGGPIRCAELVAPPGRDRGQRADHAGTGNLVSVRHFPELQDLRRWMLVTADAHGLYEPQGFVPLRHPENVMEIVGKKF